ncbi:hypothetical protein C900_03387 [Fulvivirga imtechensis AK7]|uniref:Uncharacterized protein n=1 Tax=Fulvivirga imtechensis AK7 TaxID=1237149 RepID=L8JTF8_9BACT|nr:hypothetical protein C900_03387 [Fulvivirga imtechensis AK7]
MQEQKYYRIKKYESREAIILGGAANQAFGIQRHEKSQFGNKFLFYCSM